MIDITIIPYDWLDDARPFGADGWNFGHSLDETLDYARKYGCPTRHLGRVEDGWRSARSHAAHTEA